SAEKLVSKTSYKNGKMNDSLVYMYIDKKNIINTTLYGFNGKINEKTISKYDHNSLIEQISFDSNEKSSKFICKYDNRLNEIEWLFYDNDLKLISKMEIIYLGYDTLGNWTNRATYE